MKDRPETRWLEHLTSEDLMFVRRLVLLSGSLKDLAASYGVSYPTVRLRLNRLIAKIQCLDDGSIQSEFERVLRAKVADGAVDTATARALLESHKRELEAERENRTGVDVAVDTRG